MAKKQKKSQVSLKQMENLTEKISLVTPPQSEALATADFAPINFYSGAEKSTIPLIPTSANKSTVS